MRMHVLATVVLAALASGAAVAAGEGPLQSTPSVEVTAPESDDALAVQVRQKIDEQPSLKFFSIGVRSIDHAIYLEGLVDTGADIAEADDVAASVPGVRKVYNHLYVNNG
jgi:osmotically-inducible protein OsmY